MSERGAGIVVRDRWIELAVFQATGEVGIVACARQRLPRGVVVDGVARDSAGLARALSGLIDHFGLTQTPVRLGFFPAGATIRTVDVSDLAPGQEVHRAESIVDPAQTWYQYWTDGLSLRLMACPRAALAALQAAARSAGLPDVDVELLPDAALRALTHQGAGAGQLHLRGLFTATWHSGYIAHAEAAGSSRLREPDPAAALLSHIQPGIKASGSMLAAHGLAMAAASGAALDTLLVKAHREPAGAPAFDGSRWAVRAIAQTLPPPTLVRDPVPVRLLRKTRRRPGAHRLVTRPRLAAMGIAVLAVALLVPVWARAARSPAAVPPPPASPSLSASPLAVASPSPSPPASPAVSTVPASPALVPPQNPSPTPSPSPPASPTLALIASCHQGPLPQLGVSVENASYFRGFTAYPFHQNCRHRKVTVRVVMRAGHVGATSGDTVKTELYVSIGGFEWARLRPQDIRTIELTIT